MSAPAEPFVLLGGSGFLGTHLSAVLRAGGHEVVAVDVRRPGPAALAGGVRWVAADLLVDEVELPPGHVVVLAGDGDPRPRHPWTLALAHAVLAARLAPALGEARSVTLASSVDVYGRAPGPRRETTPPQLAWTPDEVEAWCDAAQRLAAEPCLPWRAAPLCRRVAEAAPTDRGEAHALAKAAQEAILRRAVAPERLTVVRLAECFGVGQEGFVSRLVRQALAGGPLRVGDPDAVRALLPAERAATTIAARPGPGIFNVADGSVRLAELARLVADLTGVAVAAETARASGGERGQDHGAGGRRGDGAVGHGPGDGRSRGGGDRHGHGGGDCDCRGVVDASALHARLGVPPPLEESVARFVAELRSADAPVFAPALPVVVPPRPRHPDVVARRQQECLWSGRLKAGNAHTTALAEALAARLGLDRRRHRLLLTTSGTTALRLAVVAAAGPARPGDVAVLPSFTFPATAEALVQLGYALRFCDVDSRSWVLDAEAVRAALGRDDGAVRLVVTVDALGNPSAYDALGAVCAEAGVPLVADSAASLGASVGGAPVGTQADAHAFSMSFAKVLPAGGAGGAVVVPAAADLEGPAGWLRSALMAELHAVAALDLLGSLDEMVDRRAAVAAAYDAAAATVPGLGRPQVTPGGRHSWVHWVMRVPGSIGRDRLGAELARRGIETKAYYAPVLHRDPRWKDATAAALPVTDALAAEALALPMSSEITSDQAEDVALGLRAAAAAASSSSPAAGR